MKGVKKCLSCLLVFIGLFTGCLSFQCYAEEYGAAYPNYLSQSSVCFVECETYLGKGTIVLPINFTPKLELYTSLIPSIISINDVLVKKRK